MNCFIILWERFAAGGTGARHKIDCNEERTLCGKTGTSQDIIQKENVRGLKGLPNSVCISIKMRLQSSLKTKLVYSVGCHKVLVL